MHGEFGNQKASGETWRSEVRKEGANYGRFESSRQLRSLVVEIMTGAMG